MPIDWTEQNSIGWWHWTKVLLMQPHCCLLDIHSLLFLPCPGTQFGNSEGLISGSLWKASWPPRTSIYISWKGNNNMDNILHISEHLSAKCLTSRCETYWEAWELFGNRRAACTWLDRGVNLREDVRTLHSYREEGLQPFHSLEALEGRWSRDLGPGRSISLSCLPMLWNSKEKP